MELNELLASIEDEAMKDAAKKLIETETAQDLDVQTQKGLVDVLRKARAADALDLLRNKTQFKAVRKAARKALDGLRAFGITPGGPVKPKAKQVRDLLGNRNAAVLKSSEVLGRTWVLFNVPEKGGVGPEIIMLTLSGDRIVEMGRYESNLANARRIEEYLTDKGGQPLVELPHAEAAGFVAQCVTRSRTNNKAFTVEDAAHLLTLFEPGEGLLTQVEQELAAIQVDAASEYDRFVVPDPFVRGRMKAAVKEAMGMVTAVDEAQKDQIATQKVTELLTEWLKDQADVLGTYFMLAAWARLKAGQEPVAKGLFDAANSLKNKEIGNAVLNVMRETVQGIVSDAKQGLQEKEAEHAAEHSEQG